MYSCEDTKLALLYLGTRRTSIGTGNGSAHYCGGGWNLSHTEHQPLESMTGFGGLSYPGGGGPPNPGGGNGTPGGNPGGRKPGGAPGIPGCANGIGGLANAGAPAVDMKMCHSE